MRKITLETAMNYAASKALSSPLTKIYQLTVEFRSRLTRWSRRTGLIPVVVVLALHLLNTIPSRLKCRIKLGRDGRAGFLLSRIGYHVTIVLIACVMQI